VRFLERADRAEASRPMPLALSGESDGNSQRLRVRPFLSKCGRKGITVLRAAAGAEASPRPTLAVRGHPEDVPHGRRLRLL
jgi:hypothetical protein